MERRGWSSMVVAAVSAALAVPLAIWALVLSGNFWLQIALVLVPLALFSVVFVSKGRIGHLAVPPERALAGIAHAMRASLYRVTEETGSLTVRLDSVSAVKVLARPAADGTDVYFQPYATPAGWSFIIISFFLWSLAFLAVPLILFIFMEARGFARDRIASLTTGGAQPPAPLAATEVKALLIDGLSEGNRLASEAYEAEQSGYHDWLLLALLGGIVTWGLVFAWTFTASAEPDFGRRLEVPTVIAVAAGTMVTVLGGLVVRAALRSRLLRLKGWADRLRDALATEAGSTAPREHLPSSFELLSEAARQLPEWLTSLRRGGLSRDPGTWLVIVIAGFWSASLFVGAASLAVFAPLLAAVLTLGGFLLTALCYLLYQRWRRRVDSERERTLSDWDRRLDSVRTSMDQFLRDL